MVNPPLLVFSSHLGDAVISLKHTLAASPRSTVATVFTAPPPDNVALQDWDRAAGFTSGGAAMTARQDEGAAALELLKCRKIHLDFFDGRYGMPRTPKLLTSVMADTIRSNQGRLPLGPLGMGHADHEFVADCFLEAAEQLRLLRVWLYEEIPFRGLESADATGRARLELIRARGWYVAEELLEQDLDDVARQAQHAYRSQLPQLSSDALTAEEKVWLLRR